MRYLFWNTNKKDVDNLITDLANTHQPTIIALAEYKKSISDLARNIRLQTGREYSPLVQLACRVQILVADSLSNQVVHCADHTNYTIKVFPYNSFHDSHIIVFVHLPSKLRENKEKNRHLLEQITLKVNQIDCKKNRKVLMLGDFNVNPYEDPMTYLTGCNAVSNRDVAMKISRKDKNEPGKEYFYYYNPMWRFLGDVDDICGTYYYDKTEDHSRYWNTFDQFLVSPGLIDDIKEIEIVKKVGEISLEAKRGIPNLAFSDHYPLYFKLGGK